MSQHGCLKISYHGSRRLVNYKLGSAYGDILDTIVHRFKIPRYRKSSLLFTNLMGKAFDRRQLNNYLILHPNPRITFYLRYKNNTNTKKVNKRTKEAIRLSSTDALTQTPIKRKRQSDQDDNDDHNNVYDPAYPTTPVFRMNCFIGVYPSKCSPPKRVRFSENLNSIRIIPARSQIDATRAAVLPRTQSFYDGFTKEAETNSQKATDDLTLDEYTKQKLSASTSTFKVGYSPMTQLAFCSPLHRTESFINTLPTPQPQIMNFFKKKTRRMLFAQNAQRLTE